MNSKNNFYLIRIFILIVLYSTTLFGSSYRLLGFENSSYFDEQVRTFTYPADVKITVNAPSPGDFNPELPMCITLFALPNGNTTEQTIGKQLEPGDDWHYDIQHIGAQTRFIREHVKEYNLVTAYLENDFKSWPAWKASHGDHAELVQSIVDSVRNIFGEFENYVVLSGHSGGGRFTFSFLDGFDIIPEYVKRISFLDSDYGYEHYYGDKFISWLNASDENVLSVIAYNDSVALYNGQPIVSDTGGTWYRSKMMQRYLSDHYEFEKTDNDDFIWYKALDNRIEIILKKNPERAILHTVQVELNGFIQGMLSTTEYEGINYEYYGDRAYTEWIQKETDTLSRLNIPPRPADAMTGSEFMQSVSNLSFEQREEKIYDEISQGNIPDFLRTLKRVKSDFRDAAGTTHSIEYEVMPDYLAIGSNNDYCRIPMGPITAQKLADLFGASMPTGKLVDNIYLNADIKLSPQPIAPIGNQNELVSTFVRHNSTIEGQLDSINARLGQLIAGTKKDVIISNKITDPSRTHHVVIYGWHWLNGNPIQPVYNGHINTYVDYSHGIRLINSEVMLDGSTVKIRDILTDENQYKILSNETGAMEQPSYLKISGLPDKPKSFGVINNGADQLRLVLEPDSNVKYYKVLLGSDGNEFSDTLTVSPDNLVVPNLEEDSLCFLKLEAVNQIGSSGFTEVLSGIPSSGNNLKLLIVNGFDRTSDGNTFNFIRQHGSAFYNNGTNFNSCTNEALSDGLINISDYQIVDYILGDESTADETFNSSEETIISEYLKSGGRLFISGSEIAWDLDYKGSSTDKSFFRNYLKTEYVSDAPFNTQSTYYTIEPVTNEFISGLPDFNFDNGSHGTFNVKWPDVIKPVNGSSGFLKYSALDSGTGVAGVVFEGLYPDGNSPGKSVVTGFPFETIYPESVRNEFIRSILIFFDKPVNVELAESTGHPEAFRLFQNYPNPFNPTTSIRYSISETGITTLKIFDMLGSEIATLIDEVKKPGSYEVDFNGMDLSSGIYVYTIQSGEFFASNKMILLK